MPPSTPYLPPSANTPVGGIGEGFGRAVTDLLGMLQGLTPTIWRENDYAPEQWQEWYAGVQEGGKYRDKHQEFMRRVEPVFRRHFREFVAANPPPKDVPDETLDNVLSSISGNWHDRNDALANQIRKDFLDWMRDTSLGGGLAGDSSVTPQEYAEWRSEGGIFDRFNAKYRLTPTGQQQMQKAADYNLLRAFQSDPDHRPEHLKSAGFSAIQNFIGIPGAVFTSDPAESAAIAGDQLANIQRGTLDAALDNALMQDDYSRQRFSEDPTHWNTRFGGSAIPQGSMLTPAGLDRKTTGGDSAIGQATRWLSGPMFMPTYSEQMRQDLLDFQGLNDRYTPIVAREYQGPAQAVHRAINNLSPEFEQGRDLGLQVGEAERNLQKNFATYYPKFVHEFNRQFGTSFTPSYPSAFVNDAAMVIPNILGDPQNALQTLFTGAIGGLRGIGKALLDNVYEAPAEAGYSTGISLANDPQSWQDYFFKQDPGVPLRKGGTDEIPDAGNRQEYMDAIKQYEDNQKNVLRRAGEWLKNQRNMTSPLANPMK